jgi:hypothetical protein
MNEALVYVGGSNSAAGVIGSAERLAPTHSQRTNEWAPEWYQLAFSNCVAASIAHFVWFEMGNLIDTLSRLGFVATVWLWAVIAVLRMETIIDVAMEVGWTMKPRARANEDASRKPFRAVIAIGGAIVRWNVIVTVGAFRGNTDVDAYLSLGFGNSYREADCSNRS